MYVAMVVTIVASVDKQKNCRTSVHERSGVCNYVYGLLCNGRGSEGGNHGTWANQPLDDALSAAVALLCACAGEGQDTHPATEFARVSGKHYLVCLGGGIFLT